MTATGETGSYSKSLIALHWLMALLLVAVFALMEFREIYPKGSEPRELMKALHYSFGLIVFALVVLRIFTRASQSAPPIVPAPARWMEIAAKLGHLGLYAVMIAMPILGYLAVSASGKPVPFFGLTLPSLLAENKDLSHDIAEVHEVIGTIFYVLIGIHVAAALLHHFVWKDNTLALMRPSRRTGTA